MPRFPFAMAVLALTGAHPLAAQFEGDEPDVNDLAAYLAITSTPLGALPPVATAQMSGLKQTRIGFRTQFGYIDEEGPFSRRTFAGGVDIPAGPGTLSLTAGFLDFACDEEEILGDAPPDVPSTARAA